MRTSSKTIDKRFILRSTKDCKLLSAPVLNTLHSSLGSFGAKTLCYGLSQPSCKLNLLDIRLNKISNEGANFIMQTLAIKDVILETLIISSCGITKNFGLQEMIKSNTSIQMLDISNNSIGEESGILIIESLNFNKSIQYMDTRMCKISSETELGIQEKIKKNKQSKMSYPKTKNCKNFKKTYDEEFESLEKHFM
ncbi:unnamed protein product [Brassicogethes aeneus]|uniref:Uncharacterized protein n=1 Tax=Brassicogethes aeneus TaxID=1431903 RepID=A0A9P0FJM4_BRAAE|nr:unnamed protein product [Brassicogethes aeneus]